MLVWRIADSCLSSLLKTMPCRYDVLLHTWVLSACQQNIAFDFVDLWWYSFEKKKILQWEQNHKVFWELRSLLSFIACCDTIIPCLPNCSIEIVKLIAQLWLCCLLSNNVCKCIVANVSSAQMVVSEMSLGSKVGDLVLYRRVWVFSCLFSVWLVGIFFFPKTCCRFQQTCFLFVSSLFAPVLWAGSSIN